MMRKEGSHWVWLHWLKHDYLFTKGHTVHKLIETVSQNIIDYPQWGSSHQYTLYLKPSPVHMRTVCWSGRASYHISDTQHMWSTTRHTHAHTHIRTHARTHTPWWLPLSRPRWCWPAPLCFLARDLPMSLSCTEWQCCPSRTNTLNW